LLVDAVLQAAEILDFAHYHLTGLDALLPSGASGGSPEEPVSGRRLQSQGTIYLSFIFANRRRMTVENSASLTLVSFGILCGEQTEAFRF
jgi:hypothetical protein